MLGRLSDIVTSTGGRLIGEDVSFDGIGTDTRSDLTGRAYVALSGERFDGNDYVHAAREAGAIGALVSRPADDVLPQVAVGDTLQALQVMTRDWRRRFDIPVFGITGSNGKTTTKEILYSIVSQQAPALATKGNLNNHIGVPLTLARLRDEHAFAVIEMGANHAGEIATLAAIAEPTVGLVTHAGDAHLEGFGSRDGVAHAKGEMFLGLSDDGVAVINHDDVYVPLWRGFAGSRRQISFGMTAGADVTALDAEMQAGEGGWVFRLVMPGRETVTARLPLLGQHNLMNALAACAAACAADLPTHAIVAGLAAMQSVPGRLFGRQGINGLQLIDDTYNANPGSLRAALAVLETLPQRRWLALGDMAELGNDAVEVHRQMGGVIRDYGVERLWACGPKTQATVQAFGEGARHFPDHASLSAAVREEAAADICLLVKGSRSAGMEAVVQALAAGSGGSEDKGASEHGGESAC